MENQNNTPEETPPVSASGRPAVTAPETPTHKWHHPARWGSVIIAFVGCAVLSGIATMTLKGRVFVRPTVQPISFDHRKHVKDNELSCTTCHQFYEKETFSGLPDAEVCSFCHLEPQGKSADEAKLVDMLKRGEELKWQSLFRQPAHVFYSHRRHVVVAKLECPTCHGAIAESQSPPGRVTKLRMQNCIECHRRSNVSTDCTSCHR